MTPVFNLPDEIICEIFSLSIRRIFSNTFKMRSHQNSVALVDLSRVCRRWREAALADSTLWSSIHILLDNPTVETLRQATYFTDTCFSRSKDLPLTIAVTLNNLEDQWLARPLMQAVISREARWLRIAFNFTGTPHPRSPEAPDISISESEDGVTGAHDLLLRNAGSSHLKEFQSNLGSVFTYSMIEPLPALESLRISCCMFLGCIYTLTKWISLTPNLLELELTIDHNRFVTDAAQRNGQIWSAAAREMQRRPHFVLPTLRALNVWAPLVPYFTCPALEKYVLDMISWRPQDLTNYLEFIERSAPPAFHSIEIRSMMYLLDTPSVLGYFLPTITKVMVTSPPSDVFEVFSERSEDGQAFAVLPGLEYLEITGCEDIYFGLLSTLVTSRWDIGAPRRSLKSVTLEDCFWPSSIPELLFSPPRDGIDLDLVEERWREIARCVNEGLLLSICE